MFLDTEGIIKGQKVMIVLVTLNVLVVPLRVRARQSIRNLGA